MDRIRNIVVPTDFSPLAESAAARAATLASLDGAAIHLVHAVSFPLVSTPYYAPLEPIREELRRDATQLIEKARAAVEAEGVETVTAEVFESGDAVEVIGKAAEKVSADLVVMGTHGHQGIKHAFLGSVAERALRTIDCPVLAVKESIEDARQPIQRILLAVDFSENSEPAVEAAAALAKQLEASLDVVHAYELPGDFAPYNTDFGMELVRTVKASVDEQLGAIGERLEDASPRVRLHAKQGPPSHVIAELARESQCQLVVMGTRGNTGLAHVFLGSVAERTIRTAPCAVLALKAPSS